MAIHAPSGSFLNESNEWLSRLERDERELEAAMRRNRAPSVFVCDRSPIPEYPTEPRGVYVARFLSPRGRYILDCVDRKGRHVAQVVVADPSRWAEYERAAQSILDELDPILKLLA